MRIVFLVMFVTVTVIAIFYWIKYEKECEHSYELEDELHEVKAELLKRRGIEMRISELVSSYRKDIVNTNAHAILRELSEMNLDIKNDISTDQSN